MSLIGNIFGNRNKSETALQNGATIVDVRGPGEFASGHVKGSVNIPLDEVVERASEIPSKKPVVLCCASGVRSARATQLLRKKGFDAHNGGGWKAVASLQKERNASI